MAVTGAVCQKKHANAITQHEQKKKILYHATSVGNKQEQTEEIKTFVISNIVSIVSSLSKKADKNEIHAIKGYFNAACQVHKKGFYKTWTFDCSSPQYRGEMVYQTRNFLNKKS